MGKYKGNGKAKGKAKYYPVREGRTPGMYYNWWDCKEQVHGWPDAEYKSFDTEAEAEEFLNKPTILQRIAAREGGSTHSVQTGRVTKPTQSSRGCSSSQASSSSSHERIQQGLRHEQDIKAANDRMRTLGVGDTITIIRSASGYNFDVTRLVPSTPGPLHIAPAPSSLSLLDSDDITPSTESGLIDSDVEALSDFE